MIDFLFTQRTASEFSFIDDLHAELVAPCRASSRLLHRRAHSRFSLLTAAADLAAEGLDLCRGFSSRVIEGNVPVRTKRFFPANLPSPKQRLVLMASFPGLIPSFIGGKRIFSCCGCE